jgi:hypothetical protein
MVELEDRQFPLERKEMISLKAFECDRRSGVLRGCWEKAMSNELRGIPSSRCHVAGAIAEIYGLNTVGIHNHEVCARCRLGGIARLTHWMA